MKDRKSRSAEYRLGYTAGYNAGRKRLLATKAAPAYEPSEIAAAEVAWYRANGEYPADRITLDRDGNPYVIGDFSWNRSGRGYEPIESRMARAIRADVTL